MADAPKTVGRDASLRLVNPAAHDVVADSPTVPPPRRRRRRWWLWLAVPLVLVLAGAWFAPAIVARTPLREHILPLLAPTYPAAIETAAADLGWLSPVVLRDVTFRDLDGSPLLEVAAIETSLPLWKVAFHSGDVGRLRFVRPVAHVRTRPGGSNVEDVIARMNEAAGAPAARLGFVLELAEARVLPYDGTASQPSGEIVLPAAELVRPLDRAAETALVAKGSLDDGERPGTIGVELTLRDDPNGNVSAFKTRVLAKGAPLAVLGPFLRRAAGAMSVAGRLDADLRFDIAPAATEDEASGNPRPVAVAWTARGRAVVDRLEARLPGVIADERLLLERLQVGGAISANDETLGFDGVRIVTDVGRVAFDGKLPVETGTEPATLRRLIEIATTHEHDLSATVDLASLATVLPLTTRIREDLNLESGTVQVDSSTSTRDGRLAWLLRGNLVDLAGRVGETAVRWEEPVHLEIDVPRTEAGPRIERISARADFATLTARRAAGGLDFDVDADLDTLAERLARFVDLGETRLEGRVRGTGSIAETGSDRWNAELDLRAERFVVALPARPAWSEPSLQLVARATGRGTAERLASVETAELGLVSGEDRLQLRLTEGVDWAADPATLAWPLAFEVSGSLDRWQTRLEPLVPRNGWTVAGNGTISGSGRIGATKLAVAACRADLQGLAISGPNARVVEPSVVVEGSADVDLAERVVSAPNATLVSRTASLRAVDFRCDWSQAGPPRTEGGLALRLDLGRLQQALGREPAAWGTLSGSAKFQHEAAVTKSLWKLDLADPAFAAPTEPQGEAIPPLVLSGRLDYHHERDILAVRSATIAADGLAATIGGRVTSLVAVPQAELSGDLVYDWARLAPRMRSILGDVAIAGSGTRGVSLRGPLDFSAGIPRELVASGGLGWQSADAYGLAVGPGALDATVRDGSATFAPLDVELAGGRLRTTPGLVNGPAGSVLVLSPGSTLTDVQLTPELTDRWIGYATPLLANSTRAEGRFSAMLARANVPLANWRSMDAAGQLVIDSTSVTPGPTSLALVQTLNQVRRLTGNGGSTNDLTVVADAQTVNVRAAGGRVYHDRLVVAINGTAVTTSGSVGFDDTLDLVAEFAIPDEWLAGADERVARALRGQTLRLPIRGTSSSPQIDGRAVTDLAGRAGLRSLLGDRANGVFGGNGASTLEEEAAGGTQRIERRLGDEVGRGLDRLFGGRRE